MYVCACFSQALIEQLLDNMASVMFVCSAKSTMLALIFLFISTFHTKNDNLIEGKGVLTGEHEQNCKGGINMYPHMSTK